MENNLITNINNASWLLRTLGIPPDELRENHGSVNYKHGIVSIWENGNYKIFEFGSNKRSYGNIYKLFNELKA